MGRRYDAALLDKIRQGQREMLYKGVKVLVKWTRGSSNPCGCSR